MKNTVYFLIMLLTGIIMISCGESADTKNEEKPKKLERTNDKDTSADARILEEINVKIRQNPGDDALYLERCKYYFKRGKMTEALNDVNRCIELDSTNEDYFIMRGDIYFSELKAEEAKNEFEKAKQANPLSYKSDLKLAKIYLYIRNYKKSMEFVNNALKIDKHIAEGYFIKGSIYEEMRDSSNAASSFQTAIEQDPDYYDAYIRLGILYSKLPKRNQKRKMAYDYYNSAIDIRPDQIEAHYNKAIYCQDNDLPEEALEEYEKIILINPKFEGAWHNKGYVYLVYKLDFKLAIEYFSKAIELNPNYVGAYHNRGLAWLKNGDKARARDDFRKALEIDPQYDKSAIELDKLDRGIAD